MPWRCISLLGRLPVARRAARGAARATARGAVGLRRLRERRFEFWAATRAKDSPSADPVAALGAARRAPLECTAVNGQKPLELILARNLLSSISTPAFLVGEGGMLLFFNEAAAAMLGRRFEETGTMPAAEWTAEFGPFGADEQPIPYDEIPARRSPSATNRPYHGNFRIRGAARPALRHRRERDPDRRARGRERRDRDLLAGDGRTGEAESDEDQGVGGARLDPGAGPGDDALRRQHVVRRGDARRRQHADPRRRHRDPQPRAGAADRKPRAADPHPADPPPPRPHPGPDVLRARVPARVGDHHLGPGLAGGVAARPDRALHLRAARAGRGSRAAVARLVPRGRAARVGHRPGADPRAGGQPPRPDARLPDRGRRRRVAVLHPRPRARPRGAAGRSSTTTGSRASSSRTARRC